jgi:hypothetical protein
VQPKIISCSGKEAKYAVENKNTLYTCVYTHTHTYIYTVDCRRPGNQERQEPETDKYRPLPQDTCAETRGRKEGRVWKELEGRKEGRRWKEVGGGVEGRREETRRKKGKKEKMERMEGKEGGKKEGRKKEGRKEWKERKGVNIRDRVHTYACIRTYYLNAHESTLKEGRKNIEGRNMKEGRMDIEGRKEGRMRRWETHDSRALVVFGGDDRDGSFVPSSRVSAGPIVAAVSASASTATSTPASGAELS